MISMIFKMSGLTLLYIILVAVVWMWTNKKELSLFRKVVVGIIFGISSVLSTHFGVNYDNMVINVRDVGPLAAGLFFSPASGIIAGLIGGIERYIAGTYFGVGSYTRIACSVSTCLAGYIAMLMNVKVFKGKKPSPFYAFFMGAVMEVFHMYVVFITHRSDMRMAFLVVSTCAIPMIIFTGIGMALSSIMLQLFMNEWRNPFVRQTEENISVSQKFQKWLFIITSLVIIGNFVFSYAIQTQSAYQENKDILIKNAKSVLHDFQEQDLNIDPDSTIHYVVLGKNGNILKGKNQGMNLPVDEFANIIDKSGQIFTGKFWTINSLIYVEEIENVGWVATALPTSEVFWSRDAQAYELALGDILLFTVIYVLIAYLVNQIVVNNIRLINTSLGKITNGDLNEQITVRNSSEFASLSDDINQTVLSLKGYIEAAEKRIEQELLVAKGIQEAALPKNFIFPEHDEFELYASMNPAKEVGGDFFDFFFVSTNKMALVIADVSGKGIPAALFMMRSKTAIRSLAQSGSTPEEIINKANEALYEGNDMDMFVTVWIGIIDLQTGIMDCVNAGHEYPIIKKKAGKFELLKDNHSLALAAMPTLKTKPYQIKMEPGDIIFVYTDGIPEAINENVEQYGTKRLVEKLNDESGHTIEEVLRAVEADTIGFKGNEDQFDDITMLGFEFKKLTGQEPQAFT